MKRPYIWPILMLVISLLSLAQGTSLSVTTGGLLLGPAVILAWLITIIPMVILTVLDHYGLKRRGANPPNLLLAVIFAAILPSYIFTFGYLVFRSSSEKSEQQSAKMNIEDKSENDDEQLGVTQSLLDQHDDKWREIDGTGRYEVDLPEGGKETARTKDDI